MRDYAKFHEQDDFTGGMNDTLRSDKIFKNQCVTLQNIQISADGITLATGYDFAGTWASGADMRLIIPDKLASPSLLFFLNNEDIIKMNAGKVVSVVSNVNTAIALNSLSNTTEVWCGIILGGTASSPDAVLVSCGASNLIATNANTSIINLSAGTAVRWNSANSSPALSSMAFFEGRLFGVNKKDQNLYYTPVRSSWTTDSDDWEFLTIGASQYSGVSYNNSSCVVYDNSLYVFKERGVYRIEYAGGTDLYSSRVVNPDFGCLSDGQLVVTPKGVVFSDYNTKNVYLFDGNTFLQITNERSVTNSIIDHEVAGAGPTSYDAMCLEYDDNENTVLAIYRSNLGLTGAETRKSLAWKIHLDYELPGGGYAISKCVYDNYIMSAKMTEIPFYANTASRNRLFMVYAASEYVLGYTNIFHSNVASYTMNGAPYNCIVEFGSIDTRRLSQGSTGGETMRKHVRIRQVALDMSADGPVAIDVQCRDKEGTFETVKTITLSDDEFQYHQVGSDRPGFYPQFRIKSNAATSRWVLRGIEYFGDIQGMR